MESSYPAEFINLDLEIKSHADLSALAGHFGKEALVLFNDKIDDLYMLSIEPLVDQAFCNSADQCASHFTKILKSLPQDLRELWDACTSRIFDFGYDGGLETVPLSSDISSSTLAEIAEIGASIRITVYPFRKENVEEDKSRTEERD